MATIGETLEGARSALMNGNAEAAVAPCQAVLARYPRHAEATCLLAEARRELRQLPEAADLFERVLAARPDDLIAHWALSMIFEEQGQLEAALYELERAWDSSPGHRAVRDELIRLREQCGREYREPELLPGGLARTYARGFELRRAVAEAKHILASSADRLDARLLLAECLWRLGRIDEAAQAAADALAESPDCLVANLIRGCARLGSNGRMAQEARRCLERALSLDPECIAAKRLFGVESVPMPLRRREVDLDSEPTAVEWDDAVVEAPSVSAIAADDGGRARASAPLLALTGVPAAHSAADAPPLATASLVEPPRAFTATVEHSDVASESLSPLPTAAIVPQPEPVVISASLLPRDASVSSASLSPVDAPSLSTASALIELEPDSRALVTDEDRSRHLLVSSTASEHSDETALPPVADEAPNAPTAATPPSTPELGLPDNSPAEIGSIGPASPGAPTADVPSIEITQWTAAHLAEGRDEDTAMDAPADEEPNPSTVADSTFAESASDVDAGPAAPSVPSWLEREAPAPSGSTASATADSLDPELYAEWGDLLAEEVTLDADAAARLAEALADATGSGVAGGPWQEMTLDRRDRQSAETDSTSLFNAPAGTLDSGSAGMESTDGPIDDMARAELLVADGDLDGAAEAYRDALRVRGEIAAEVIVVLRSLVDASPGHPGLRRALGDAYMRAGRFQKAIEEYNQAVALQQPVAVA